MAPPTSVHKQISLSLLSSGKWIQQNPPRETLGGGLRHLYNRAPKFQLAGDSREGWIFQCPSPCRPLPHIHSQGLSPACSFTRAPFTRSRILPKKEKCEMQRVPPLICRRKPTAEPPISQPGGWQPLSSFPPSKGRPRLKLWPFSSHLELLHLVINSSLNKSDPLPTIHLAAK